MSRMRLTAIIGLGVVFAALLGSLAIDGIRWRIEVLGLVASGRIRDLGVAETARMIGPKGHYYLKPLLVKGSPYLVIRNPYETTEDSIAGAGLFRARCALCHDDASHGTAPRLNDGQFRHGATDWALFRSITQGIPGTAMLPEAVSEREAWQLITYIRGRARRPGAPGDGTGAGGTVEALAGLRAVGDERLLNARRTPADWLTYSGAYDGWRFSALSQITTANVGRLRARWILQMHGSDKVESSPIVVDGIIFLTEPPGAVLAIDGRTGKQLWFYLRELPDGIHVCCGEVNRGVAVSGNRVYVATLDAHLLALDARTGAVSWDVSLADWREGYSATGAPLVVGDRVLVGIAGGEYGTRGFIDAYEAGSGRQLWRFNTVPGPGEAGHETWGGESWEHGGAPTWLTGSYDPELRLVYWGVGNPAPNFDGDRRPGRNLYSNSVVALDPTTGRLRWYFQFTPHDQYDWDSVQIPVLVDATWQGSPRRLMLWANRNGFYYVLDRATGEFLLGQPFVKQTWAYGLDQDGRPILRPNISPTTTGTALYPSILGGTNWWSPSFSPKTGYLYIPILEAGGVYHRQSAPYRYRRGEFFNGSAHEGIPEEGRWTAVRAIDARTGRLVWDHRFESHTGDPLINGVMATAGGLVFGSDRSDMLALDASSGRELWRFNTGGTIWAAPVAYEVDGTEIVTIATGRALIAFSLK